MKQNNISTIILLLAIFLLWVTLFTLPNIERAQPDPYFHVRVTPIAYWVGFSLSLIVVGVFSVLLLRQRVEERYRFLWIFSLAMLTVFIYVIPRLMYVNKIYTDTYQFVSETLYVLRYGHVGFGYIESPALSLFVAQLSLIVGVNYVTFAEFLPLAFPFIYLLYVYMVARLIVEKHVFLLICLTLVALNWFGFFFNRQSFALILQLFVWYCVLRVLLVKRTSFSRYVVLILSYSALVISHPASPFVLTINTFGIVVFVWLTGLIQKHMSGMLSDDYRDRRKLLIKASSMAMYFLVVWLSWQTYAGRSFFMAVENTISAFMEFLGTPSPSAQVSRIVSGYTSVYYPIVTLRLFEALFVTIAGIFLSVFLLVRVSKLKSIILSSWVISTISLNVYVLYAHSWIYRPIIYSLPAFSVLLALFLTLFSVGYRRLVGMVVNIVKVGLLGAILLFAVFLPLVMYSHTPFMFPSTSYLKELNFITEQGDGSVVVFDCGTEFGYYIMLNNASINPLRESQFFDPELGFLMSKLNDCDVIGTSFRVYTKEGFVFSQQSWKQITTELDDYLVKNPSFTKIYEAGSWHKVYAKQSYFNYLQVSSPD